MVLRAAHAARRGAAAEVLRYRDQRAGPLHAAQRLHRPDHAGRCAAAREHRGADPGVPPLASYLAGPRASRPAHRLIDDEDAGLEARGPARPWIRTWQLNRKFVPAAEVADDLVEGGSPLHAGAPAVGRA